MRVYPKASDFKFIVTIVTFPKRVIALIAQIAKGVWARLSNSRRPTRKLTESQVRLLNDIKLNKHTYKLKSRVGNRTNDPDSPPSLRSRASPPSSSHDLSGPQYESKRLPPVLQELREAIRTLASDAATILYEEKIEPRVLKLQQGGIPKEVEEMIEKTTTPVVTALRAVLHKYKGKAADPKEVETAVKDLIHYVDEVYSNDLSFLIKTSVSNNSAAIADILACRALELLAEVPFGATVDAFGDAVCGHILGIVQADSAVNGIIKRSRLTNNKKDTQTEIALLDECRSQIVTADGEAAYRSEKMLQAFTEASVCHEVVRQLAGTHAAAREASINELYSDFADDIMALLLPKRTVCADEGLMVVDGASYLWDSIEWPPELNMVKDQVMDILRLVLPERGLLGAEAIEEQALEIIESSAISFIQDNFRGALTKHLKQTLESLTDPAKLRKMIALKIFPGVDAGAIPMLCKLYIIEQVDRTAPLFSNWLQHPDSAEEWKGELTTILYDACMDKSARFKTPNEPITSENFAQVIEPLLEDIYRTLSVFSEENALQNESLLEKVKQSIKPFVADACALYTNREKRADLRAQKIFNNMSRSLSKRTDLDPYMKDTVKTVLSDRRNAVLNAIKNEPLRCEDICNQLVQRIRERQQANCYETELVKAQLRVFETAALVDDKQAPPYGEMVAQTLFELGGLEFGCELGKAGAIVDVVAKTPLIQARFKEVMQANVLGAMRTIREGYEEPIAKVTETLSKYQDKDTLRSLMTAVKDSETNGEFITADQIEARLDKEIEKVALITRDLLEATAQTKLKNTISRKFAKKALLPSADRIQGVIRNCLDKIGSSGLINTSLALTFRDLFLEAAREASQKVHTKDLASIRAHKIA